MNIKHVIGIVAPSSPLPDGLVEQSIGAKLIEENKATAKAKGATQIVVVCGAHDNRKRKFLIDQNLSIASEWFVGGIV